MKPNYKIMIAGFFFVFPIHWATPSIAQSIVQSPPTITQSEEDALPENGGEIAMGSATLDNCLLYSGYQPELSNFGATVAIDGDYAVVTSPYYDDAGDYRPGGALLYRRQGTSWTWYGDLTPPPVAGHRGASGAFISGNTVAVVNQVYANTYIYRRDGNHWPVEAIFDGSVIAVDGDVLLLGNSVYRRTPTWAFEAQLVPTPNTPSFGAVADIDGDRIIVSAWAYGQPGAALSGAAYIFRQEGNSWVQEARLLPPEPVYNGRFGWDVAISGNYAVIGQPNLDSGNPGLAFRLPKNWPNLGSAGCLIRN